MIKISKNTIFLLILTVLTLASWFSFQVYRTITKESITKTAESQLQPLDPNLDLNFIDYLNNKNR